ncbi:hypothetical protein GCM10009616_01060 [Microlunatus lacustris]
MRNFLASRIPVHCYVVIRFSVRFQDWTRRAYGQEDARSEWFAMRARLFRASVVASLERQTVAPRRVFVLMDVDDVALWHQHLDLPAPYVPVFVRAEDVDQEISARLAADDTKNIVISRLDSDDAISRRYFEKITDTARNFWRLGITKAYMVAPNGHFTDLRRIQRVYFNCSPFISLYVHRYHGENIFDLEHLRILERHPVMVESVEWMQIIHGTNIGNRLYKKSRFEPDDERKMELGDMEEVGKGWPQGFPPGLAATAKSAVGSRG